MDADERSFLLPLHEARPSKQPRRDTTTHNNMSRWTEIYPILSIVLFYLFTVVCSAGCVIYSKVNNLNGTTSMLLVAIIPNIIDQIWLIFGGNPLELSLGVSASSGESSDDRKVGRKASSIGKQLNTLTKVINIDIHLCLLTTPRLHPAVAVPICTLGSLLAMACCLMSLLHINVEVELTKDKVNDERESRGPERDVQYEYDLGRGLWISGCRKLFWTLAAGAVCVFLSWMTDDVVVPAALFHNFISIISACDSVAGSTARSSKILALCKSYGVGKSLHEGWSRYGGGNGRGT